jgi:hypothetical protein
MIKSESIKNIAAAMLVFAAEVDKIEKTETNPFFKSKYASLPNILAAIKTPLERAKLVVSCIPTGDNQLTTLVLHTESGEYLGGTNNMMPVKSDPQSLGSAITYNRRYCIGAILNLNIDDDDDGNTATHGKTAPAETPQKPWLNPNTEAWTQAVTYLKGAGTIAAIKTKYNISKENENKLMEESI